MCCELNLAISPFVTREPNSNSNERYRLTIPNLKRTSARHNRHYLNATRHVGASVFENLRMAFKMRPPALDCSVSSLLRSGKSRFTATDSTSPQPQHHRDTHPSSLQTANRPSFGPSFCLTCLMEVSSPESRMKIQSCESGVSASSRGNWLNTREKLEKPLLTLGGTPKGGEHQGIGSPPLLLRAKDGIHSQYMENHGKRRPTRMSGGLFLLQLQPLNLLIKSWS
jgi:hypothetical protein